MAFPQTRPRRLRRTESIRRMVRETALAPADLMLPLFAVHGRKVRRAVRSMPGVFRLSVDELVKDARKAFEAGVPGVLLFGLARRKDAEGSEALSPDGVTPRAVRALKKAIPELVVATDLCLCAYTSHGHCGVLRGREVDNDATLERLAQAALVQADSGADLVAPSDMMDGRVGAIRTALDEAGFSETGILAYSAKYASSFYGPFRDAAGSSPAFGDRRSYQMDPANAEEALREVALDLDEGADIVMVKPALAYLDVVRRVKDAFSVPLAAYHVSGEYAALKAAAAKGWLDWRATELETLTAIRRAGADIVITYSAAEAARWLAQG